MRERKRGEGERKEKGERLILITWQSKKCLLCARADMRSVSVATVPCLIDRLFLWPLPVTGCECACARLWILPCPRCRATAACRRHPPCCASQTRADTHTYTYTYTSLATRIFLFAPRVAPNQISSPSRQRHANEECLK